MKLPKLKLHTGAEIKALRKKIYMNQSEFWERVGTTQSGGSRYEAGRAIPDDVLLLVNIVYGTDGQAANIFESLRRWKEKR